MASDLIVKIGEAHFAKYVEQSDVPVLIDFYADWCPPCRQLSPILEELAAELGESARIVKVNADEQPGLAGRFGVTALPTLVVFKGGVESQRALGLQPKAALAQMLKS